MSDPPSAVHDTWATTGAAAEAGEQPADKAGGTWPSRTAAGSVPGSVVGGMVNVGVPGDWLGRSVAPADWVGLAVAEVGPGVADVAGGPVGGGDEVAVDETLGDGAALAGGLGSTPGEDVAELNGPMPKANIAPQARATTTSSSRPPKSNADGPRRRGRGVVLP